MDEIKKVRYKVRRCELGKERRRFYSYGQVTNEVNGN